MAKYRGGRITCVIISEILFNDYTWKLYRHRVIITHIKSFFPIQLEKIRFIMRVPWFLSLINYCFPPYKTLKAFHGCKTICAYQRSQFSLLPTGLLSIHWGSMVATNWWLPNLLLKDQDVFESYCFSNLMDIIKTGKYSQVVYNIVSI